MLEIIISLEIFISVLMLIFLQKQNQMKKQIESIVQEVNQYIDFITEEAKEETSIKTEKVNQDESQNHIIQAVLKEYFP